MYCARCGNHLRENSKFCDKCGATVVPLADAATPVTAAPVSTGNSAKKVGIIVGIVVGVLVLIALIVLILSLASGDSFFHPAEKDTYSYEVEESTTPVTEVPYQGDTLSADNPYYDCYNAYAEYVLPESSQRITPVPTFLT